MNIDIQFTSFDIEEVPGKKGTYKKGTCTYKDIAKNKIAGKVIVEPFNKEVFAALENATKGTIYSVEMAKEGDFWNWKSIARQDAPAAAPEAPQGAKTETRAVVARNQYEERDALQRERFDFDKEKSPIITRLSCISSAVDLLKDHGKQPDAAKVLEVAEAFFQYATNGVTADVEIE